MRTVFLIIVLLHALIHLLGFVKGFSWKEVENLTLPISKPMGLLWLVASLLFLIYGILYYLNHPYVWLFGFIAVVVSQILIILFWKDAKWATLPNLLVLLVSIIAYGHYNFQQLVQVETRHILSKSSLLKEKFISEDDIKELPEPVQKWLHRSGAMDKPSISRGKVIQQAEMKMKPEQEDWLHATAVQYTIIDEPAFIWKVDVKMNSLINFQGRDKFEEGKGEMLIKLNALINVVNEKGEKLNEGTLQRYLGEMVWFPSLAVSPYVSWQEVDDNTAIATMNYKGTKGSGTFYFNPEGDFIKFSAMRYKDNKPDAKRYEWVLLVEEHKTFEGIKVPSQMTATWKLESGDWTWLKLEIKDIQYNEKANR
ncbi:hypothetical protein JKA74_13970 [Marivirga sp. S37H4]|uniref:Uncharacterized protein n=1 Tax=Marivirga aurantiaca TaxID=2802615 RepID=A0A934X0A8_9BACT|nr:DUF6544 family protein [Marivirga aurantiaca]MBK6266147.1 hypothetical protein [Marivirga aurantiaca]